MSTQKVFTHLDFQNVNEIKNAIINPFADLAALDAYALANSYGAAQEGVMAYNKDTDSIYLWTGTQWVSSDKDNEVILNLTSGAPIDTDVMGVIVTATTPIAPALTANTKFLTWVDANGDTHLYQVEDPTGTPIIKEITTPKQVVLTTTATDTAGITALPPRANTIYKNATTGAIWMVTEDSNVTQLSDGNKEYYGVFNVRSITANTTSIFDVNDDASLSVTNLSSAATEEAFSEFLIDWQVFDASNGNQLTTDFYGLVPSSVSTCEITPNIGADVIVSFHFLGKADAGVSPQNNNSFTFATGTVPTISAFETAIGFTLSTPVVNGDIIEFSNTGYAIPNGAFLSNAGLLSVVSQATTIGSYAFGNCNQATSFNLPAATNIDTQAFDSCSLATSFNLPAATTIQNDAFLNCYSATSFNINSAISIGATAGKDGVFGGILGNTISVTAKTINQTSNGGGLEGDLDDLNINNTVTFTWVP